MDQLDKTFGFVLFRYFKVIRFSPGLNFNSLLSEVSIWLLVLSTLVCTFHIRSFSSPKKIFCIILKRVCLFLIIPPRHWHCHSHLLGDGEVHSSCTKYRTKQWQACNIGKVCLSTSNVNIWAYNMLSHVHKVAWSCKMKKPFPACDAVHPLCCWLPIKIHLQILS